MTQHTPGPWEYNKDSRWPNCLMAPKGAPGALSMVRVAQIAYLSKADKALIEAAPELLEALGEFIVNFREFEQWPVGKGYSMSKEAIATFAKARAAIAKATGSP